MASRPRQRIRGDRTEIPFNVVGIPRYRRLHIFRPESTGEAMNTALTIR
jgi:hypothetical protein